jgi:hypothetical protein
LENGDEPKSYLTLEVNMFTRFLIVMTIVVMMISACTPAKSTAVFEVGIEPATAITSNQDVKDELGLILRAMQGAFWMIRLP